MYTELIDPPVEFVRLQGLCRLSESNTNCGSLMAITSQSLTRNICYLQTSCRQLHHSADIQEDLHRCMFIISKFTGSRTYVCRVVISSCRAGYYCLHKVPELFIFKAHGCCFFWQTLFICHCRHGERQIPISSFAHREQLLLRESNQPIKPNNGLCYLSQ